MREASTKKRSRTWVPLTVLALVALAGITIMFGGQWAVDRANHRARDRFVASLDAEAAAFVDRGSNLPTVVDWFKRRGMGFHYYLGPDPASPAPNRPGATFHGLPSGQVTDSAEGTLDGVVVYFYFGDDGRAIRYRVFDARH
jgi:hypothetical protein